MSIKSKCRSLFFRLKILVTRRIEWLAEDGAVAEVEKASWRTAWTIAGVHSVNWKWVHKWGKLECGCTKNPITRRMVLFVWKCPVHMPILWEE